MKHNAVVLRSEAPSEIATSTDISTRIRALLSTMTERNSADIDLGVRFEELGLSSVEGLMLLGELEVELNMEIEPSEVFKHSTVDHMCRALARRAMEGSEL